MLANERSGDNVNAGPRWPIAVSSTERGQPEQEDRLRRPG